MSVFLKILDWVVLKPPGFEVYKVLNVNMNNFVEFWNQLGYNKFFLILLVVFFICHIAFLVYRTIIVIAKKKQTGKEREEGVSVIITCSNQAELLQQNLEAFLNQDYPCFEVIVVDECSEDETQEVLSEMQKKYPALKTSRIFPGTKFRRTKKIAINIGVLAAQYDVLLFSEIDCRPEGKNWIRSMQAEFDENTAVVIGFANYAVGSSSFDIRRYFRFLWFWKAILFVRNGMNVIGNGYNMGYRKKYYLEKRGFSGNTQEYIGYDTEMVRELSRKGNVKVVKGEEARIIIGDDSRKAWKDDYSYYYATKRRWPWGVYIWSNADFVLETIFYILSLYFVLFNSLHEYFVIPIVLTYLIDLIVINICLKHLGQRKLFLTSLTVNTFGFAYKWYYSIYSIFTSKKWR